MPNTMNPLSSCKLAISTALCAFVIGCASNDTVTSEVVRTPPPSNYEKTITDYLAFKIRNPQKNAEVNFGAPEPGACALDAYTTSSRGWVVPVAYVTRTGEATGKETIRINTKQYYFWFLGNTIAGITPRIELCPGNGASFEAPPSAAPVAVKTTAAPVSTPGDADSAAAPKATAQKPKATSTTKKSGASSSAKPPAKKKPATSVSSTKPT